MSKTMIHPKRTLRGPALGRPAILDLTKDERLIASEMWARIGADVRPRFGIEQSRVIDYFHRHCSAMSQLLREL